MISNITYHSHKGNITLKFFMIFNCYQSMYWRILPKRIP